MKADMKLQLKSLLLASTIVLTLLPYTSFAEHHEDDTAKKDLEPNVAVFGMPIKASSIENQKLVDLGKKLYLDPILSVNNKISCSSCHKLDNYGVDGEATSPGHDGRRGGRNSPTVYNAYKHIAQFWDGRANNVEEQALGPILNPIEMGMSSEEAVVEKLRANKEYPKLFKEAFGNKSALTYKNIGAAIGAFERTLDTPSRFDKYLAGDKASLTQEEKVGLQKFIDSGCIACHNGTYLGGMMYQKLGLVHPYPNNNDMGRYEVTKNEADRGVFKVPSLRNVTKTGPYFHDGSAKTIEEAVKLMGYHQLGRELQNEDISSIVTFLKTLEGETKE